MQGEKHRVFSRRSAALKIAYCREGRYDAPGLNDEGSAHASDDDDVPAVAGGIVGAGGGPRRR